MLPTLVFEVDADPAFVLFCNARDCLDLERFLRTNDDVVADDVAPVI